MNPIAYFNGSYLPKADVHLSPDDRGFLFADGIYDALRAYRGRIFELDRHLRRLTYGLGALRIGGVEASTIGQVFPELLRRNGLDGGDALFYVQITRGVAPRAHAFPPSPVPPTVYAGVVPFKPRVNPAIGAQVITLPDQRWTRCDIKSVALLPNCMASQLAAEAGAEEALLVRDGVVLEGTHSSFFGVFGGVVKTAPLNNYILPGVTREVTLELCAAHGIPAAEGPIFFHELPTADELFLASTTYEILPIVKVDGRAVGDGVPGPMAQRLLALLQAHAG